MTIEQIREREARLRSLWFQGAQEHPHGVSGKAWIIDGLLDQSCTRFNSEAWQQ